MMGFQASGSAPLVNDTTVTDPETIATAIHIGNPVIEPRPLQPPSQRRCLPGCHRCGDHLGLQASGRPKGIFCEPASAASVAGLLKRKDEVPAGATVVCVLTGNTSRSRLRHQQQRTTFFPDLVDLGTVANVMGF